MIHRASEATGDGRAPWGRLLVLCGVLALHNAMRIGPVTFIEELRGRYGVDYAGAGNVVGAYTLAYGFAQLLAGLLADRIGSRRLMLVGLGLGAVGSATFAATEDFAVALAARLLMGVAGGCLYTPTIAYTFAAFPSALRGRAPPALHWPRAIASSRPSGGSAVRARARPPRQIAAS